MLFDVRLDKRINNVFERFHKLFTVRFGEIDCARKPPLQVQQHALWHR